MAKHSQVPKFGDWESDEDVQYTTFFDNAAKGKKGNKMNPNDPQNFEAKVKGENGTDFVRQKPERFASRDGVELRKSTDSPTHPDTMGHKAPTYPSPQRHGEKYGGKSESKTMKGPDIPTPRHERRPSREEGYLRKPTDSPLRNENMGRRTPMESPHHRYGGLSGGSTPKRASQQNVVPDRSIEHSPLHPHSQGRAGGKGGVVFSPSWERKASSEGSHGLAPSTPGRSRLRPVAKGDDTPDDSPAVPKFGDWDENDPASAEGYSQIFNKVREEKQTGSAKVPSTSTDTSYSNSQKRYGNDSGKGCSCFPWGRR